MKHVRGKELPVGEFGVKVEVGLKGLAWEHGQFGELVVKEGGRGVVGLVEGRVEKLAEEEDFGLFEAFKVEGGFFEELVGCVGVHLDKGKLRGEVATEEVEVADVGVWDVNLVWNERGLLSVSCQFSSFLDFNSVFS